MQESEASEIYVRRLKTQEVFVEGEHDFPCAKGTLRLPHRQSPSLPAEGLEPEGDVEIEEGDKKREDTQKIRARSTSGVFIYRHHEELRLKFYDSDNETFPIPLKYVDVMRETQNNINNVSEHLINDLWTEAKRVTLAEEWTGTTKFQIL